MPLIQLLHWNLNKGKKLENYQDRVLPGTQPFELNWLSLIYVYLVGIYWFIYMFATIIFWPLMFISSWIIIPVVFIIPFSFLHVPVQILNGRMFCCRCSLWCWKKSDVKKLSSGWEGSEQERLAKYFNVKENELENHVRDSNVEKTEGIELLTLKALTVLYLVLSVTSLYFLPAYYGKINMYEELVNSFTLEFNLIPMIEFISLNFDFQFIFQWPDELNVRFQIVLFFSISLIIFERLIAILLFFIDQYIMGEINVNEKSFQLPMYIVYLPYKVGEIYYICFEIGWEMIVGIYGMIMLLFLKGFKCVYYGFKRCGKYPFGEMEDEDDMNLFEEGEEDDEDDDEDDDEGEGDDEDEDDDNYKYNRYLGPTQFIGIKYGLYDVIGKTGFYTFFQKFPIVRERLTGKEDWEWERVSLNIGSGLTPNIVSMWMLNNRTKINKQKKLEFNHHLGDEGVIALSNILMNYKFTITKINLHENNFSDKGCESIGEGLKTNNTLTELNLFFNNMDMI